MPVAERTYWAWKHAQPSSRDIDEAHVIDANRAARVNDKGEPTPESMYGRRRMTAMLRPQGVAASSRRVERLMRELGVNGLVRGKGVRTTIPTDESVRPVNREATACDCARRTTECG